MSRYARQAPNSGETAWDAKLNANHQNLFDRPIPIHEHTGDQTDLQSTFNANQYDNGLVWVDHTTEGFVLYHSDGTSWDRFSTRMRGNRAIRDISSVDSVVATDDVIELTGSGTFALTLEAVAATNSGRTLTIKQNGTGTVTVTRAGGDTIDGATTQVMSTQYDVLRLVSDGSSAWMLV